MVKVLTFTNQFQGKVSSMLSNQAILRQSRDELRAM